MRGNCAKNKRAVCKDCKEGEAKQVRRKAKNGIVHSGRIKWWSQMVASSARIKSKVIWQSGVSKVAKRKVKVERESGGENLCGPFWPQGSKRSKKGQRQKGFAKLANMVNRGVSGPKRDF